MTLDVDIMLLRKDFTRTKTSDGSFFYYKLIDDKEYIVYVNMYDCDVFVKCETEKTKRLRLFEKEIEPYFNGVIRKDKIKKLLCQ